MMLDDLRRNAWLAIARSMMDDFPDEEQFLRLTNFNKGSSRPCRSRIADHVDYEQFLQAGAVAVRSSQTGQPYYWEADGGTVSKSYGYRKRPATSGRWGVYVDPDALRPVWVAERVTIWPGDSIRCIYFGGSVRYESDFRKANIA